MFTYANSSSSPCLQFWSASVGSSSADSGLSLPYFGTSTNSVSNPPPVTHMPWNASIPPGVALGSEWRSYLVTMHSFNWSRARKITVMGGKSRRKSYSRARAIDWKYYSHIFPFVANCSEAEILIVWDFHNIIVYIHVKILKLDDSQEIFKLFILSWFWIIARVFSAWLCMDVRIRKSYTPIKTSTRPNNGLTVCSLHA